MWHPAQLKLIISQPAQAGGAPKDPPSVLITIDGAGFGPADQMTGAFVRSGSSPGRTYVIPCNDIKLVQPNRVTVRVCTIGKARGKYDLVWWLVPPPHVLDENSQKIPDVPINDVDVLPEALTVT